MLWGMPQRSVLGSFPFHIFINDLCDMINNSNCYWAINSRSDYLLSDHFCGLVVRVTGYRSRGLSSIPSATRYSKN
jgi:hypothetical protein